VAHTGYRHIELIGKKIGLFKSGYHNKSFYKDLWKTILSGNSYKGIFVNRKKDQQIYYEEEIITPIMDDNHTIQHFVATSQDITERVHMEKKLQKLATIDNLTGIYNRHKSNEEIDIEISRDRRYNGVFALAMFDIDHFKHINDTYGHDVGDYVLKEFSTLISKHIRDSDRFGRWGGEEFILLLPHLNNKEAMSVAQKLRKIVANYAFKDIPQVTTSVGITIYTPGDTKESLLKRVDHALYKAKKAGRNKVRSK
jgi:diguanylate cyclase (GGDEF)-like protein/PAS domain S-box-containing protein